MIRCKKNRLLFSLLFDLILLGIFLCVFALYHHVIPRSIGNLYGASNTESFSDFSLKFPDKFTSGEIIEEDGFYNDENIHLTLTTHVENGVTYHVADFYVRNVSLLKTAMATEEFTTGVADSVLNMAKRENALLAVSGDYFGIRERGVVIRNGEVFRKTKAHQICVLYANGTMETYSFADFDIDKAIAGGAWQAWDFGPMLLDENGKAITEFKTGISGENPRIGIGYFEEGHYCLVAIDGRQSTSRGMTLSEMASLFENLGCKKAYNLDGGHSAAMVYKNELFSSPSKEGGRDISDIIYLDPKALPASKEEK
ncbi:MAG: phosphodiester glycosidase family protein [Clostridia bacterium]|nr:phosphodiester glycosidase family protein [Clostridia bacterium]